MKASLAFVKASHAYSTLGHTCLRAQDAAGRNDSPLHFVKKLAVDGSLSGVCAKACFLVSLRTQACNSLNIIWLKGTHYDCMRLMMRSCAQWIDGSKEAGR
jgi:hypothetical protein